MQHKLFCIVGFLRCWLVVLPSLLLAVNVNASSIKQVDVNELIEQSELVFEGRVVSSDARWNEDKTLIKTFVTFEVDEVIAGDYQQSIVELSFVGGTIGTNSVEAKGLRQPVVGEKGIYFVHSLTRQLVNPLVGWSQGQFLLEKDESGNDVVMTDARQPVIGLRVSASRKLSATSRSELLSEGVATDVMVNKSQNAKEPAMKAVDFKSALKLRMKNLNK